MEKGNIVVLYTEFMPYNLAAFQALAREAALHVHIVYWDHKKLTPYLPPSTENLTFIPYSTVDRGAMITLVKMLEPKFVFVSGWTDKTYMAVAFYCRRNHIDVVLGFDTKWTGNLRQVLQLFAARFLIRSFFSKAFVPGNSQYHFARKLGFRHKEIQTGAYTADVDCFGGVQSVNRSKSILFIGRLSLVKGIDLLVRSFLRLRNDTNFSGWSLIIVGNGELRDQLPKDSSVIFKDFLSQQDIAMLANEAAFFCLPSRIEAWGLVVHEMASAGLPLLLSDSCGSAEDFLIAGYNGFTFHSGNDEDLSVKLSIMMSKSFEELRDMGERSRLLSQRNSPQLWSYKLLSLIR
ncbi:MAG TPA: glycosyltransferase [Ohtaekwangia sp.]